MAYHGETAIVAKVRAAQYDVVYDRLLMSLVAAAVFGLLLVGYSATSGRLAVGVLVWWYVALLIVAALRFVLRMRYFDAGTDRTAASWRHGFMAGAVLSGLVWGAASIAVFDPDSPTQQFLLALFVGGMAVGSATSLAPVFRTYVAYVVLSLTPLIGRFLVQDTQTSLITAFALSLFTVMVLINGWRLGRLIEANMKLREESLLHQAQLEEIGRRAEEANKAKTAFLGRMSHELRTPLNAILGFSQVLERDQAIASSESLSRFVNEIHAAGRHLLALIEDVLDVSKIESGRLDIEKSWVDVREVIAQSTRYVTAAGSKVEIVADLPDELPAHVYADATRLRQILVNLLSNAIKYGGTDQPIVISATPLGDGGTRFSVRDGGPGIDESRRAEVFEPFKRLVAPGVFEEGVGLGLAITRALVEQMGGGIDFDNLDAGGCEFWFVLPGGDADAA